MPPVVAAAAIGAGGAIIGGAIQHRTARDATNAQRRATQEAIAREERREAEEKAEAEKALENRKQAWYAWFQRYGDEGLQRYGMPDYFNPFPGAVTGAPPSGGGRGQGPTPTPAGGGTVRPPASPPNLGTLMGAPPTAPGVPGAFPLMDSQQPGGTGAAQQPGTLGDLGGWNDWNRYLTPGRT